MINLELWELVIISILFWTVGIVYRRYVFLKQEKTKNARKVMEE